MSRTAFASLGILLLAASAFADDKPADTGRYQIARGVTGPALMIDTTTGECWARDSDDTKWIDLRFPVKETKVDKGTAGRFRLEPLVGLKGLAESVVVWDTTDGRCWTANYDPYLMKWKAIPSPRSK